MPSGYDTRSSKGALQDGCPDVGPFAAIPLDIEDHAALHVHTEARATGTLLRNDKSTPPKLRLRLPNFTVVNQAQSNCLLLSNSCHAEYN
jgi:hypothetical protein